MRSSNLFISRSLATLSGLLMAILALCSSCSTGSKNLRPARAVPPSTPTACASRRLRRSGLARHRLARPALELLEELLAPGRGKLRRSRLVAGAQELVKMDLQRRSLLLGGLAQPQLAGGGAGPPGQHGAKVDLPPLRMTLRGG